MHIIICERIPYHLYFHSAEHYLHTVRQRPLDKQATLGIRQCITALDGMQVSHTISTLWTFLLIMI